MAAVLSLTLSGCPGPFGGATGVSVSTQQRLYTQTVGLIAAQRSYAIAHQGHYSSRQIEVIGQNASLAPLVDQNSPLISFQGSDTAYSFELADQDSGGAASFTVLMPASGVPVFRCYGPGPVCVHGNFQVPAQDYTLPRPAAPTATAGGSVRPSAGPRRASVKGAR